jgi:hypothetical protein
MPFKKLAFIQNLLILVTLFGGHFSFIYAFCYQHLLVQKQRAHLAFLLILIDNFMFFLILWLYSLLILELHKAIRQEYTLDGHILRRLDKYVGLSRDVPLNEADNSLIESYLLEKSLNVITRNSHGQIGVCLKCKIIRPDRAFHCETCSRCILKRDHHCPWLNVCIGFSNQKYFLLFLAYVWTYLIFVRLSLVWYDGGRILLAEIVFLVTAGFISLLLLNSLYLASVNLTNIEQSYPPRFKFSPGGPYYHRLADNLFRLDGKLNNLKQIFGRGDVWTLWLLPVWTTLGDGHEFPLNMKLTV